MSFCGRAKGKTLVILCALALAALTAVVLSLCCTYNPQSDSEYLFDLNETGGVGGFLSQFSLDYDSRESTRELTMPSKDDEVFADYADFLSDLGVNVLKASGKRVEEQYLRLKNKTRKGQTLYAVIYIYKEKITAAHLSTLEQGSELLPITAFV